ncbi:MAG: hypothetical protein IT563_06640 [Alphaproteobacteria bacterium]|nr:hypothetical protein [Alphaproteobacteria bacterium]
MTLQFDEDWLDLDSGKFAADLRILGNVGDTVVRFVVPRQVALRHFTPPRECGAEEGLAIWARSLQQACKAAYRRRGAAAGAGDITVDDADFSAKPYLV